MVGPCHVGNAALFVASDEARDVTGPEFTVDAREHDPLTGPKEDLSDASAGVFACSAIANGISHSAFWRNRPADR
jgi:hypothetical protein